MALSQKSLAGPGYIILNVIRAMNIIGLLAVITAAVVVLVKTTVDSRFFFFDAVSHVLMLVSCMFLLASELSLFRSYFARNWPLLSPAHGFVALASAFIVLGINILGDLNKDSESQKHLGLAFWRIVIGSGCLIFSLGWINLVASYVFRDRQNNITARQVRAHGAVAIHKTPRTGSMRSSSNHSASETAKSYLSNPVTPTRPSNPFRIFTGSDRNEPVLPSYYTSSPSDSKSPQYTTREVHSPTSRYSRATNCTRKKVLSMMGRNKRNSIAPPLPVNPNPEISGPMGVNPQFAHLVQRPDSALHPSRTGESEAFRWNAH
ncbi:hypothetical protein K431DRAFT_227440 [Polychaeton citri CBS 116435]|uniref:DUF7598 domain-containing protein n=1 Tax=Polychaeton citri CBS 116435 TaxID=1314669 RepID=A0A9P4Q7Z0_9PEZI|nr:hypothetical protein K431DRAFT_227440 [Polychaeton citri CBS 116435]